MNRNGCIHSSSLTVVSGPMFAGKTTRLVQGIREALDKPETYHSVVVLKPALDTREGAGVPPMIRTHDGDEVRDGRETSPAIHPTANLLSSSSPQDLHINPPVAPLGLSERVLVCPVGDPEWVIGRLPVCVDGKRVFVGVDEVQFFTAGWVEVLFETLLLMRSDVDLFVVGLDMDRGGKVFPGMECVEGFAAKHSGVSSAVQVIVEKLVARCTQCGGRRNATHTFYKGNKASGDGNGQQVLIGGSELYEPRCYEHWLAGIVS